jgi:hypothetical protein
MRRSLRRRVPAPRTLVPGERLASLGAACAGLDSGHRPAAVGDGLSIPMTALFGEAIRRIHRRESISILFE